MLFVTIDIVPVPDPDGVERYVVEISRGSRTLASWSVRSEQQGREQILEAIDRLNREHNPDTL